MCAPRMITIDGRTQRLSQWCRELSIGSSTVYRRLRLGWTEQDALTTPRYWHTPGKVNTKWYTVYNARTDEFICDGSAVDVADTLGLCGPEAVYQIACRCKYGLSQKYIVDVIPMSEAMGDMAD